jgi:hypothetical protein
MMTQRRRARGNRSAPALALTRRGNANEAAKYEQAVGGTGIAGAGAGDEGEIRVGAAALQQIAPVRA